MVDTFLRRQFKIYIVHYKKRRSFLHQWATRTVMAIPVSKPNRDWFADSLREDVARNILVENFRRIIDGKPANLNGAVRFADRSRTCAHSHAYKPRLSVAHIATPTSHAHSYRHGHEPRPSCIHTSRDIIFIPKRSTELS